MPGLHRGAGAGPLPGVATPPPADARAAGAIRHPSSLPNRGPAERARRAVKHSRRPGPRRVRSLDWSPTPQPGRARRSPSYGFSPRRLSSPCGDTDGTRHGRRRERGSDVGGGPARGALGRPPGRPAAGRCRARRLPRPALCSRPAAPLLRRRLPASSCWHSIRTPWVDADTSANPIKGCQRAGLPRTADAPQTVVNKTFPRLSRTPRRRWWPPGRESNP